MKRFSSQFKRQADSVTLRAAERRDLRDRISTYMEYHPLSTKATSAAPASTPERTEAFRYIRIDGWKLARWSGVVALVALVVVPMLAERAVPGDTLYAVKVKFNEEVRGTLARSPHEKVAWETARLNRRIAEARLLASEGRLTEEAEHDVAEAVRTHRENAEREIEALKATDVDEAAIASLQLDTALEVQSASLRGTEQAATSSSGVVPVQFASLLESTRTEHNEAPVLPSYERLVAQVEMDTTRAFELLESIRSAATSEERTDIERRLADIERSFAVATAARSATGSEMALANASTSATATEAVAAADDRSAREQLLDVLRRTHRLIVFMTNIDVRNSVEIDELVPVVPTDEERRTALNTSLSKTEQALTQLEPLGTLITEPALAEKFDIGLADASAAIDRATSSLATDKLGAAETAAAAAAETAQDLQRLVDPFLRSTTTSEDPVSEPGSSEEPEEELEPEPAPEVATSSMVGNRPTSTPPVTTPAPATSSSERATSAAAGSGE